MIHETAIRSGPHGWIQFKGSNLCMDVHCVCGELTHIDADFLYHVKCGVCSRVYELSGFIEFKEVPESDCAEGECYHVSE